MVLMGLAAFLPAGTLWGQPAAVQEQVAALTQTLQKDEARLKQYEWIETTSVNVKGKMVSRTQKRCVWGEDGKLQKVLITPSPEAKKRRGLAAWIAEKRKKELKDYIKSVVEMLKTYVPPDPASLQAAQDAGKVSLHVTRPGARVRLKFRDYHRAGDRARRRDGPDRSPHPQHDGFDLPGGPQRSGDLERQLRHAARWYGLPGPGHP
jgi:hypothetical protein